jgi:hypothetical protein
MDDFETFKASREKMDPSARKLSAKQWQRAYDAYCASRERLSETVASAGQSSRGGSQGSRSGRSERRKSSRSSGRNRASDAMDDLRREVRARTAYEDLRLVVDVIAWVALGVIVLAAVLVLLTNRSIPIALGDLLQAVLQILAVLLLRLLAQALIDIPDIALYRLVASTPPEEEAGAKEDAS